MSGWTQEELDRIGRTEEIQLAPLRHDGTLHAPVTVWVVRVGDDLYVRSWRGQAGAWFRAARASGAGRLRAGNREKEVAFVPETDPACNDQIDAAYRRKYRRYPSYVRPMVSQEARSTTLKLVPRPSVSSVPWA
jgi:hypothetical protein